MCFFFNKFVSSFIENVLKAINNIAGNINKAFFKLQRFIPFPTLKKISKNFESLINSSNISNTLYIIHIYPYNTIVHTKIKHAPNDVFLIRSCFTYDTTTPHS